MVRCEVVSGFGEVDVPYDVEKLGTIALRANGKISRSAIPIFEVNVSSSLRLHTSPALIPPPLTS